MQNYFQMLHSIKMSFNPNAIQLGYNLFDELDFIFLSLLMFD